MSNTLENITPAHLAAVESSIRVQINNLATVYGCLEKGLGRKRIKDAERAEISDAMTLCVSAHTLLSEQAAYLLAVAPLVQPAARVLSVKLTPSINRDLEMEAQSPEIAAVCDEGSYSAGTEVVNLPNDAPIQLYVRAGVSLDRARKFAETILILAIPEVLGQRLDELTLGPLLGDEVPSSPPDAVQ